MKQKSLVVTAAVALLAGTVLASAQGMQKQAPGGGAMEHGAQQDQEHAPSQAEQGKGKGPRQENRAQGPQKEPAGTVGQGQKAEQKAEPKAHDSEPKVQRGQKGHEPSEPKTSGQGQQSTPKADRDQEKGAPKAHQGQPKSEPRTQGQRTGAGAAVTLTTEQRTHIRETVLRGGHAPRLTKVNFSISVGTVVPRSVKIVAVPTVIVDIHPEWRGFLYFVYEDQIIIVDRNHHIIAILDA